MAECQVNLNPTKGVMLQESRWFLHPASLDSVLQLAIIAAHGGRHGSLETRYLPVYVKQMRVSVVDVIKEQAVAHAKSGYVDVRTITADVTIRSSVGTPILIASDIRLAQTQGFTTWFLNKDIAPFTRMEWKPDFDHLNEYSLSQIFPSTTHELGDAELSTLDLLALHQIIQFFIKYPEFFQQGSRIPHLQPFLTWMTVKVEQTRLGEFKGGVKIMDLTVQEREDEMARLFKSLMDKNGPETRLMSHMYESLPAIHRGELSGIEAAVQDHLLDDM